jgi:hypothetical protein
MQIKRPDTLIPQSFNICCQYMSDLERYRRAVIRHDRYEIVVLEWVFWFESQGWQFEGHSEETEFYDQAIGIPHEIDTA